MNGSRLMEIYHLTINGVPYCRCEFTVFGKSKHYPTNCAHGSRKSADEGAAACRAARPDVKVEIVEGVCHSDPWWSTRDGRQAIREEDDWNEMSRGVSETRKVNFCSYCGE